VRTCQNGHATPLGKIPFMPKFYCENTAIPNTEEFEMFGVTVDDKIKFKTHIANVWRKDSRTLLCLSGGKRSPIGKKKVSLRRIYHSPTTQRHGISVTKLPLQSERKLMGVPFLFEKSDICRNPMPPFQQTF